MKSGVSCAAMVVALTAGLVGISRGASSAAAPHGATHGTVLSLLADNHLIAVSLQTGKVLADPALRKPPVHSVLWGRGGQFYGHYLAMSKDRKTVYALVLDTAGGSHHLAVVDATTSRVRARLQLRRGIVCRSLVVGPLTGRVYLFGNRTGKRNLAVIVTVLDPGSNAVIANWTVRNSGNEESTSLIGMAPSIGR